MSEQTVGLGDAVSATTQANGADKAAAATPAKARGTTTSDPKLVACIRIAKMIDSLSPSERAFVLDYIGDKYNTVVAG